VIRSQPILVHGPVGVVASPRDESQPTLQSLGDRARKGDAAVGMTPGSRGALRIEGPGVAIEHNAGKAGYGYFLRRVPCDHLQSRFLASVEEPSAAQISHRIQAQ